VKALFYPAGVGHATLDQLILGVADEASLGLDLIGFPTGGGDADLELAVPFLPGMDEVVVSTAELRLVAREPERELPAWQVVGNGGRGVFLALDAPARLRRVVLDPLEAPLGATTLIVRSAAKAGSAFAAGPPILSDVTFPPPSSVYPPVLGGIARSTNADGAVQLLIAGGVQGQAWLIQYAKGGKATELEPLAWAPTVRRVTVLAAPTDLTVVLRGETDVALWSHPSALLPGDVEQVVSFAPLAQRRLAAALAASAGTPGPTLPVRLCFHSASGGELRVTSKTLDAGYLVRPLGPDPVTVRTGGDWAPLDLSAPAGLQPASATWTLDAKHLGRELNQGSPLPPLAEPHAGVRVDARHWVAAALPFQPAAAEPSRAVASARAYVEAPAASEAVLELRADAGGAPGAPVAPPVVRRLAPAPPAWVEFELPAAGAEVGVPATLWLLLRCTAGELRWFATPGAGAPWAARVSLDQGASWGDVDRALADPGAPLAQLFHRVDSPLPDPAVQLFLPAGPVGTVTLGAGPAGGPAAFRAEEVALPGAVRAALAAATGKGKAVTRLTLLSRQVLDLTVRSLVCAYDPFAAAGGG
jgi:hypothetical protein